MDSAVYTIEEFCAAHKMSKAKFYQLRSQGRAPRIMSAVGKKQYISTEAAADWRKAMEQGDNDVSV